MKQMKSHSSKDVDELDEEAEDMFSEFGRFITVSLLTLCLHLSHFHTPLDVLRSANCLSTVFVR